MSADARVFGNAQDAALSPSGTPFIDLTAPAPVLRWRPWEAEPAVALEHLAAPPTTYNRFVKPAIDRVGAALLLLILLPSLALIALGVRILLGRGVLFRQQRVGHRGRPFTVYKFRTMAHDRRRDEVPYEGVDRRSVHKSSDDPRHTRFGRILRQLSLDELPQLVNILRGEMSLVGPRPELTSVARHYEPWQHARHAVKPGLTGPWQVSQRGQTPLHEATALDLEYVRQLSLLTDCAILLRTLPAVVTKRGT